MLGLSMVFLVSLILRVFEDLTFFYCGLLGPQYLIIFECGFFRVALVLALLRAFRAAICHLELYCGLLGPQYFYRIKSCCGLLGPQCFYIAGFKGHNIFLFIIAICCGLLGPQCLLLLVQAFRATLGLQYAP